MSNADAPANPHSKWDNDFDKVVQQWPGLTKREHFAGLAMQGLLASWDNHDLCRPSEFASDAVLFADALLAELAKTNEE